MSVDALVRELQTEDRRTPMRYCAEVPLLLIDLDNTLIDRAAAFTRWAERFVAERGAAPSEVEWLITADRDGYEDRERLAGAIRDRFGLDTESAVDVLAELRDGLVEHVTPDDGVIPALRVAAAAGWVPFVVTNGTVHQQERKLRQTGLDREVAGWAVSEGVGARKPDAVVFEHAARRAGGSLDGAWMIGDSAEHDIAGAHRLGLSNVWLHRGRTWSAEEFEPTHIADDCPRAIELATSAGRLGRGGLL